MIDKSWIGHRLPDSVLPIERRRLQFFAKAIGETDPIYTDATAARVAGYRDVPVPPTFLFAAELDSGATFRLLTNLGVSFAGLLHGEQSFIYHRPACVGDTLTVRTVVKDIYERKNGTLEFIVTFSRVTDEHDELILEMRSVLVVRN